MTATAISGSTASLAGKPSAAIETARPRLRLNHRPMAVIATWVSMPWPKKRRPNSTRASIQAEATDAIASEVRASPASAPAPSQRIGNRSADLPAHISNAALATVATV